jgi:hypothetical protein
MAEANDFQIWLETVDTTGKVGIYLEDGEVKAINEEEPKPAPKTPKTRKKIPATA